MFYLFANLLHIHGTADEIVPFTIAAPSVEAWATHDRCGAKRDPGLTLDLDGTLAGNETYTEATAGCPAGVAVDFWIVQGGIHVLSLTAAFEPERGDAGQRGAIGGSWPSRDAMIVTT